MKLLSPESRRPTAADTLTAASSVHLGITWDRLSYNIQEIKFEKMSNLRKPLILASILLSTSFYSFPALAEGESTDSGAKSAPEASADAASTDEKKTVLQGGVRGSAIRLEEGLVMIESSAKMLQGSALEIAKETTRKETVTVRGPNYIGNGIVIPAIGNPNGTMQMGSLPARRDKMESFISTAEEIIKALRTHVDGLIIPEGSKEEMNNLWKGMQSSMQAAENNIATMRELVNQVPGKKNEIKQKDAKPIGQAALHVYDSMTALEKMRSQIDDMVKAELKGK
ncbi:MAG: hypothetical protein K2X81_12000 [Candidatus Obscuribacterales bacterium]|nr:hypothetical protein [Candidatus Obscuribacterales bacterium]